jgi:hypothetical protein
LGSKWPSLSRNTCKHRQVSKATGNVGGFTVAGPEKGPFRNRQKQKQEQKQKPRTIVFITATQAIRVKTYSGNSQSSTATLSEPEISLLG